MGANGHEAAGRGRHRIFLGYAAGVGKTYAMLSDGLRRARLGEDVVVGLLEAHARPETAALASGLETLPLRGVEYHGVRLPELDLDAALSRHPDWLLVDELAHTNIPGSVYEKRWESVEVLLEAGISVMSTVNIQHLESLNSFVFRVTGVWVHETVPDCVLAGADEIVFVDIPPDALLSRVNRGGVRCRDEVGSARTHFFRGNSLAALRDEAIEHLRRYDDRVTLSDGAGHSKKTPLLLERLLGPHEPKLGAWW
jgi:two-component system sensor histidine kinase KdpD